MDGGNGWTSSSDLSGTSGGQVTYTSTSSCTGGEGASATNANAVAAGGVFTQVNSGQYRTGANGIAGTAHGNGFGVRAGAVTTTNPGANDMTRAGGGGSGWAGGGSGAAMRRYNANHYGVSGGGGGSSYINTQLLFDPNSFTVGAPAGPYGIGTLAEMTNLGPTAGDGGSGMFTFLFNRTIVPQNNNGGGGGGGGGNGGNVISYGTRVTLDALHIKANPNVAADDVNEVKGGTLVYAQIACSSFSPPSQGRRLDVLVSEGRHLATSIPAPPNGTLALNATVLETGQDLGQLGWVYTDGVSVYQYVPFYMPAIKGSLKFTGSIAYPGQPSLLAGQSSLQLDIRIYVTGDSDGVSFVLGFFITFGVALAALFGLVCCCCVPMPRDYDEDDGASRSRLPAYTWQRVAPGKAAAYSKVN